MNWRLIIPIVVVVVVVSGGVFCIVKNRAPSSIPTATIQVHMKEAQKSFREGDLLKAKKLYTNII